MTNTSSVKHSLKFFSLLIASMAFLMLAACDTPEEKAQSHYENGKQLFAEENFVKAGLEFRNALQLNGNIADAWYHLALVEEKDGKFREYAGDLYKTIELDTQHTNAHIRIGKLLLFSGRLDEAFEKSELAIRQAPELADAWSLRAAVLFKKKDTAGAIEAANKAVEIEPSHVEASLIIIIQAVLDKNPDRALELADEALKTHNDNIPLQLAKMQAYQTKGDKAGIEAVFRELIQANPKKTNFRNNLTQFYLEQGQKDKAEAEIRAIAEENPEDESAKLNVVRFVRSVAGNEVAKTELKKLIEAEPQNYTYQFALSEIALIENDFDQAKSILQLVIDKAGLEEDGLSSRNKLAEILLREGKQSEALTLVEEVIAVDNLNVNALTLRAAMRIEDGDVENAITDLRSALREQPDSSKATLLLARAHEMNGAVELADDRFDAAFKMANGDVRSALQYAQFLTRRGNHQRAGEILTRSLRVTPNNQGLLTSLAQVKLRLKDWKGAEEIANRIKAIDKDNTVSDQILGRSFAGQEDFDKSMQSFQKAFQSIPNGVNSLVAMVRLQVRQGRTEEAKTLLGDIIKENPDNFSARLLLGQLHAASGNDDEALIEFEKVVADAPEQQSGHYVLFTHYVKAKDFSSAKKTLDTALVTLPDNFTLTMSLAGLYELQNKFEDAIGVYEDLLLKLPNSEVVSNNLASLISTNFDDEQNLRRAYSIAKKFRSSSVPHFKDTLGWIHYKLGEYELATPLFEDAVEKLPNFALLRFHLGMSYKGENNTKRAIEELSKAVELSKSQPFPEAEEAKKALSELEAS